MDVRVGRDPAALAPAQHALERERQLLRLGADFDGAAQRRDLVAAADLDVDRAERQVDHAFAVDIGVLLLARESSA